MANHIISQKLKQARIDAGLSQKDVYEYFGISQSTFSSWETGKGAPSIEAFLQLCIKYEIDDITDYFLSDGIYKKKNPLTAKELSMLAELPERSKQAVLNCINFEHSYMISQQVYRKRLLPVYLQSAAAGLGNPLTDAYYELLELNAPDEADMGIRISGDSMEPRIHDGDIVFVKSCLELENGQIGIFNINGEAYCKVMESRSKEDAYLRSLNPKYSPIHVSKSDFFYVIGRVLPSL